MPAFTLLGISLAMAAAGTATQAIGQVKSGNAAKRAGIAQREAKESEAQLAEYNAGVADIQATDALQRGQEDEQRVRAGVRGMIGKQRAGFAAANIDVGFGSAVDVQEDAAFLGEQDALTTRNNAAREAWGFNVQAEDLRKRAAITRQEGSMLEAAGREQQKASRYAAAGTIIGGGASLAEAKYGFDRRSS